MSRPPGYNANPANRLGIVTVIEQAVTLLKEALPAEIATLNAWNSSVYGSATQIAMPAEESFFDYLTYPKYVNLYPAIMVVPLQSRLIDHSILDEYKMNRSWVVDVLEQGTDWGDITRKLELWELAIFEILGGADCLDAGHTVWQGSDWNQPRQTNRETGDLLQDLPMLFDTTTYEYPNANP